MLSSLRAMLRPRDRHGSAAAKRSTRPTCRPSSAGRHHHELARLQPEDGRLFYSPAYEVNVTIMNFVDPATPHEYNPKTDGYSPAYEVKARPT